MGREKPPAITDPLVHASQSGMNNPRICGVQNVWEPFASFETTNGFRSLDNGYVRHCAPTAITNLLLSFEARRPVRRGKRLIPEKVFQRVAAYGLQKHIYWNTDFLRFFGGTLNLMTGKYIRDLFRLYGRSDMKLFRSRPAGPSLLKKVLQRGDLCYMELMLHPLYGNHHVLAYGYREVCEADGKKKRLYLTVADGWSAKPRYIDASRLFFSRFLPVGTEAANSPEKSLKK